MNDDNKILNQRDLYEVLPFGETKVKQLIRANQIPVVKIGKDYITTYNLLEKWIEEHVGEEIYF